MKNRKLRMVSLFSGIGGLDEGLHQAGFESLFCCELDKHARKSLENWVSLRKQKTLIEKDVTEIDPFELRSRLKLKQGELDLLAGGPPCQSFSLIGKRCSLNDPRGLLLFQMARYAQAFMPKAILIEQVKGLRSACNLDGEKGGVLSNLVDEIEDLGYSVCSKVLKASDYGVPQNRERLFVIAIRDGSTFTFPEPTHTDPEKRLPLESLFESTKPHLTVKDVISDLPTPVLKGENETFSNHIDVTPRRDRERIHGVPEGKYLAAQLHLPAEQRLKLNAKKDTTKFRRLSWDKPSLTIRGGEAFYHPDEDRYITPREAMRLHGFPDQLVLEGPVRGRSGSVRDLDQHRQVANAVPPPLAEVLGQAIARSLRQLRLLNLDNRDRSVFQQSLQ